MKQSEQEDTDTRVIYAPTNFYDACDDCDTLPEERWEEYRQRLLDENENIVQGRERVRRLVSTQHIDIETRIVFIYRHRPLPSEVPMVCSSWAMFSPIDRLSMNRNRSKVNPWRWHSQEQHPTVKHRCRAMHGH
jgi:hypothetical protein